MQGPPGTQGKKGQMGYPGRHGEKGDPGLSGAMGSPGLPVSSFHELQQISNIKLPLTQEAFKQSGGGTALENYLKVLSTFAYYSLVGRCILLASV